MNLRFSVLVYNLLASDKVFVSLSSLSRNQFLRRLSDHFPIIPVDTIILSEILDLFALGKKSTDNLFSQIWCEKKDRTWSSRSLWRLISDKKCLALPQGKAVWDKDRDGQRRAWSLSLERLRRHAPLWTLYREIFVNFTVDVNGRLLSSPAPWRENRYELSEFPIWPILPVIVPLPYRHLIRADLEGRPKGTTPVGWLSPERKDRKIVWKHFLPGRDNRLGSSRGRTLPGLSG